jgi:hypothetical protein
MKKEYCAICGCILERMSGAYGTPSKEGRGHPSRHHYVAERFFGRSGNRRGDAREGIFKTCPWGVEGKSTLFCYECHEELLHNPVLLPEDLARFRELVKKRGLAELHKSADRIKIAGRVKLFHEIIEAGLLTIERRSRPTSR